MNLQKSNSLVLMSINLRNRNIVYILFFVLGGVSLSIFNSNNDSYYKVYAQYENISINTIKLTDSLYIQYFYFWDLLTSVLNFWIFLDSFGYYVF